MIKQKPFQVTKGKLQNLLRIKQRSHRVTKAKLLIKKLKKNNIG